ncbi:MAG: serine hydrolase [Burkholderiaceae bacterium]
MQTPSRLIRACLILTLAALVVAVAGLIRLGIPVSAAGMAAKQVCSGTFIAGRDPQDVMRDDVRPTSIVLQLASIKVDTQRKIVVGEMPGSVERYAVWRAGRGCTLLAPGELPELPGQRQLLAGPADRATRPTSPSAANGLPVPSRNPAQIHQTWPLGQQALTIDQWPDSINKGQLVTTVETAFASASASSVSPLARPADGPNTRAVLIAHRGQLLIDRYGGGFDRDTPQLGWSMTKTVMSVLTWKLFHDNLVDMQTPVIELMRRMPRVDWANEWLRDERAAITLTDLVTMKDGLNHIEGYSALSKVPYMLYSVPDIGRYAGSAGTVAPPGKQWRYSSAVTNLLSRVLRDQFTADSAYWQYPSAQLFKPIDAKSAIIETDSDGTFVGSSYMWATPQDWLRVGQLLANDGRWAKQQVFPAGWLQWATQPTKQADGKLSPYGAHVWLTHENNRLQCPGKTTLPANGFVLTGHMGQALAVFPDQELVILRLGWTVDSSRWNSCQFLGSVLASVLSPSVN